MPEHNGVYHWFVGVHFLRALTEADVDNLAAIGIRLEIRVRWYNCPAFHTTYPGDPRPDGQEEMALWRDKLVVAGFSTTEFELELKSVMDDNSNL